MQPISYLGSLVPDALDQGLVNALAEQFQLTEVVPSWGALDGYKWAAEPWSRLGVFPTTPGDLLATNSFDLSLPYGRTTAYPTLSNPLHVSQEELQGLATCKRVVCPTESLADLLTAALGYRPGVIKPGAAAVRPFDPQRAEYGREELRQALWTDITDQHLVIIADWLAGADELLAAMAQADQPHIRLIFRESGPVYQGPFDQLVQLNGLEDQVRLANPVGQLTKQLLFNAADLYIPARAWSADIELAMAYGCVPCVPDIDFWAERVDQQRGIELPTYFYVEDEGQTTFRYDPHGVAQLINGLTAKELRQRRLNGLAWAQDPANSWTRKVAQWQQVLSR